MVDIASAVETVQASGQYRLLQRLQVDRHPGLHTGIICLAPKTGVCLDTETTGFVSGKDKIIEMGMVSFEYDPTTYQVIRITGRYSGFEDPGEPLCQEVIDVTGITDDMLFGQRFDDDAVNSMLAGADIIIAHNAQFDRPFTETRFPIAVEKCWACTMAQINWSAEHISSRVLEYLLFKCGGWFIDAHRALADAEGVLGLLLENLPHSGALVFQSLIEKARTKATILYAVNSPFETKDALKERGYRWGDGSDGKPRAWWKEIEGDTAEEFEWLGQEVYNRGDTDPVIRVPVNAYVRFSRR